MTAQNMETLFSKYQWLLNRTIYRNMPLIKALGLDNDDVFQDLSIAMFSALGKFDPKRSNSLPAYLTAKLQYEILNIKRRNKPHGITQTKGTLLEFLYLDQPLPNGQLYEMSYSDDDSAFEVSEFIDSLSELETNVVNLKTQGHCIRKKKHNEVLGHVSEKYKAMHTTERRAA